MRYCKGHTLIELLFALAIVGVSTAAAVPGWRAWVQKDGESTQLNQLMGEINFARSMAIQRGVTVTLCKSADQKTCSGDWMDGQLIFIDKNRRGQVDDPQSIVRVFRAMQPLGSLQWRGAAHKEYLQFNAEGMSPGHNGTFVYCSENKDARVIVLAASGRARLANDPLACDKRELQ
jgi:type IV fimbrial biogenesis protein FimT